MHSISKCINLSIFISLCLFWPSSKLQLQEIDYHPSQNQNKKKNEPSISFWSDSNLDHSFKLNVSQNLCLYRVIVFSIRFSPPFLKKKTVNLVVMFCVFFIDLIFVFHIIELFHKSSGTTSHRSVCMYMILYVTTKQLWGSSRSNSHFVFTLVALFISSLYL